MRRSIVLAAALVVLALPRVAAAQTPSVTPTPAPVPLTFRFDCDAVPWSCGDGPNDVRWQLYEILACETRQGRDNCTFKHLQAIHPGDTVYLTPYTRYRLFLAPNADRSDRVGRADCDVPNDRSLVISIYSQCAINSSACAGPENWNVYFESGGALRHAFKHIGDCSVYRSAAAPGAPGRPHVLHWGLPGDLTASSVTTLTPPPATLTPTAPIPTNAPTVAATRTASPTPPGVPQATLRPSPTAGASSTPTPPRAALLLPMLWK